MRWGNASFLRCACSVTSAQSGLHCGAALESIQTTSVLQRRQNRRGRHHRPEWREREREREVSDVTSSAPPPPQRRVRARSGDGLTNGDRGSAEGATGSQPQPGAGGNGIHRAVAYVDEFSRERKERESERERDICRSVVPSHHHHHHRHHRHCNFADGRLLKSNVRHFRWVWAKRGLI